jgi:hypothetical protein
MKATRRALSAVASVAVAPAVALLAAGLLGNGVAQADPEPAPPPAPASAIDKDGTYKVGVDILPGTYTSGGPTADSACYWKRVGADGKLLDNALTKKPASVRIEATDASFTTNDCQNWQLSACGTACPPPPPPPGPLGMLGQLRGFLGPNQFAVPLP